MERRVNPISKQIENVRTVIVCTFLFAAAGELADWAEKSIFAKK